MTSKEINKPQDLLGKKIAVSGIRTTGHQLMTAWFKKFEINEKEVGFIMTGGTAGSFATLASGQVAGAVLTPPYDDKAVTKGFKKFMLIGDLLDIPTSGLIAARTEVTNHRGAIRSDRLDPRQSTGHRQDDRRQVQNHTDRSQRHL